MFILIRGVKTCESSEWLLVLVNSLQPHRQAEGMDTVITPVVHMKAVGQRGWGFGQSLDLNPDSRTPKPSLFPREPAPGP